MFDFNFLGDNLKVGHPCILDIDEENCYHIRFLPNGVCACRIVFISKSQQYAIMKLYREMVKRHVKR